jgi:hypothetical protein
MLIQNALSKEFKTNNNLGPTFQPLTSISSMLIYNIKGNVFVDAKCNEMSHNHSHWTLLIKIAHEIIRKIAGRRKLYIHV